MFFFQNIWIQCPFDGLCLWSNRSLAKINVFWKKNSLGFYKTPKINYFIKETWTWAKKISFRYSEVLPAFSTYKKFEISFWLQESTYWTFTFFSAPCYPLAEKRQSLPLKLTPPLTNKKTTKSEFAENRAENDTNHIYNIHLLQDICYKNKKIKK